MSMHTILFSLCVVWTVCAIWILYQTTLHPLAAYPGPFLAKLTRLPAVYHAIRGTRHQHLYEAHQYYGAIVRCGPNHISINSASALTQIYGANANVRKSTWYTAFFGDSVFNTRDKHVHARKKRSMASAFSNQSVQAVQSSIIDVIRDWCAALGDDGTAGDKWASPKDMSRWSAWIIFDSLGSLLFGQSFNTTRSVEHRPFLTLMEHNIWFLNILGHMPPLKQLKLGAVVMRDQGRKLGMRLAFARKLLRKRLDLGDHHAGPKDLVHYLMRAEDPETGKGYDEHELISEINMLLVAGSDTTNTALASLFYFLAHHRDVLDRLTSSIRNDFTNVEEISSGQVVASNTYLKACVDEALRLCPPVPMLLPREVCTGGLSVMGHHFASGTILGVPTYTLHHNERYFKAPFEYRPERWMSKKDSELSELKLVEPELAKQRGAFVPFGIGPRACMGRYVALLELYVIIARVVFAFDIRLEPGQEILRLLRGIRSDNLTQRVLEKVSFIMTNAMNSTYNVGQDYAGLVKSMNAVDEQALQQDSAMRAKVLASARRLCQRLESPWERIARMFWGEPWITVSVQIASHMGLFGKLRERDSPCSAEDLSKATGKSENLIKKLLRTLSAAGFLNQSGTDAYSGTLLSEAMLTRDAIHAVDFLFESGYPYFAQIPGYVKRTDFVAPKDMGAWQNFRNTKATVYEWFGAHPEEMANFVGLMKVWSATQEPWLDLYPVDSLLEDADEEGTLLVDVAGGGGRDIEAFLQKYPNSAGRLVLQDRPEEVQAANVSEGIERMPHDFFTPQPVKGARIYFLHAILHNYTDEKAREILNHLKESMRHGYSRLLAYEDTIKDLHPTELSCGMDLTMMATFGTGARTETEWILLFRSVNLKLVNIYESHQAGQCIIELEL